MELTAKIEEKVLREAKSYARELLKNRMDPRHGYHTFGHTQQVVEQAIKIGQEEGVSEGELKVLELAAWIHDLGYVERYIGHEAASIEIADRFLKEHDLSDDLVEKVKTLIAATQVDKPPENLLEMIIKDADLYNLSLPEALDNSERIREEWRIFCDREFTDLEWDQFNMGFFEGHKYFTAYGRQTLEALKQQNVRKLEQRIGQYMQVNRPSRKALKKQISRKEKRIAKLEQKLAASERLRPDRGIETMFRSTYRTHINLSSIADNKANILLSINALLISIIITKAVDIYNSLSYIIYPSISILVVSMFTIVFAILATRPKVNSGVFTRDDILNKRTNLLFFGNFHRMKLDDYKWGISEMMKDADYLYSSMTTDIYFLGVVLAKKFQLLRLAYNVFMYGMAISVLFFVITFFLISKGILG